MDAQAWQRLLDHLACGIVLYDADDRLVLCNADFRRLYSALADELQPGRRFEDILRRAVARGVIPEAAGREEEWVRERLREHAQPTGPLVRRTADGRWRRIVETPLPDGSLLAFSVDITEQVAKAELAERALADARLARERLDDAIEALPDAFALYDADDRLVVCNTRYRETYATSAPALNPGARFEDILRYGLARGQYPQAAGREAEWLAERLQRHRNPASPHLQQLPGNRWLRIDERRTRDGGIAGVRAEVTELVRREQRLVELNAQLDEARARLEQLSETDELTGIANRRHFERRLAEEVSRLERHGTPFALLLVDVDHFKRYNDLHGHQQGDRCLRQVAQVLAARARRPTDLVARYGGEEFAVLLPHTTRDAAMTQAMRLLAAVDDAHLVHGDSPVAPFVTLSLGGALAGSEPRLSTEALVQAADRALYRAKAAGRHRVEFA
ncbi:MAG: diguanylate cyclase [Rubrivivax sp.]|nr:diguanylate cyclase [Rubrivivax sp.]